MNFTKKIINLYEEKSLTSRDFVHRKIFQDHSYVNIKEKILQDLFQVLNNLKIEDELLFLEKQISKVNFEEIYIKRGIQILNGKYNINDNKDSLKSNIQFGTQKLSFWINYNVSLKPLINSKSTNNLFGYKHSVKLEPLQFKTKNFIVTQGYQADKYSINNSSDLIKLGIDESIIESINIVISNIVNKNSQSKQSASFLETIKSFIEMNYQHVLYFEMFSSEKKFSCEAFLDRLIENSELIVLEDKKVRNLESLIKLKNKLFNSEIKNIDTKLKMKP